MDSQSAARPTANVDAPSRPSTNGTRVQQPKPQALPARSGPNSILVSSRQKGNTVLNHVRAFPWEYADIPADYVLGATTCALFLSLKYHRLHPEYIYTRIRSIAGKYNLRVLLTIVDIQNHEEPLKELSKTSLINNVTLILCWSAQEAARYLELYKSCEHAAPTAIRAHQSTSYSDKLVEFITEPRGINKTDAVSLISSFGSLRTAINAAPEDVALVPGFGVKKVQRWCNTVREPFRVRKAARRGINREDSLAFALARGDSTMSLSREPTTADAADAEDDQQEIPEDVLAASAAIENAAMVPRESRTPAANGSTPLDKRISAMFEDDDDEDLAELRANLAAVEDDQSARVAAPSKTKEPELSAGIAAALAKFRQ